MKRNRDVEVIDVDALSDTETPPKTPLRPIAIGGAPPATAATKVAQSKTKPFGGSAPVFQTAATTRDADEESDSSDSSLSDTTDSSSDDDVSSLLSSTDPDSTSSSDDDAMPPTAWGGGGPVRLVGAGSSLSDTTDSSSDDEASSSDLDSTSYASSSSSDDDAMPPTAGGGGPNHPENVDDEELDKEEVKGMLRQSLDERAELEVKNEELQKELAAERKEMKKKMAEHEREKDRQLIEKVQLFAVDLPRNGRSYFLYYRNPHLLRLATAANMMSVLDIEGCSGGPLGKKETFLFLKVDSCQELVQVFENGIPVGTKLEKEHFDRKTVLFSVAVITRHHSPSTVAEGQQSTYLPVCARSPWYRFNYPLARHLEQSAPFPQELPCFKYLHMNRERHFSQEIQDAVQGAAYDAVIDDVSVPTAGKEDEALKYKLDFNKMLAIPYEGTDSITIGFTHGRLPNGTTFQPG